MEIITAPGARPNAAWLNFVVTTKARSKIRQFLRTCAPKSPWCWAAACSTMPRRQEHRRHPEARVKQVLADTKHENL